MNQARQSQVASKNKLPKHMTACGVESISTQEPYTTACTNSEELPNEFVIQKLNEEIAKMGKAQCV